MPPRATRRSPTTARRDRGIERKLYQRQGVGEYWIVDTEAREVEVWSFAGSDVSAETPVPSSERFRGNVPVRVEGEMMGEIDLADVLRED